MVADEAIGGTGARTGAGSASIERPDYWWYRARAELLRAALQQYVGDVERTLDVGSADGPSVGWLRERKRHVSLDIDPRGLRPGDVCGSALALPFADRTFDVVTAFDVIEHCESESGVLAELIRVLTPGGRLLLSVPAYTWAWTNFDVVNGHYRRYTRRQVVAAVQRAGVTVERATYAFTTVFPLFAAQRLVTRLVENLRGKPAETPSSNLVELPRVPLAVERALSGLARVDEKLLARVDLPFGSSIFVAARKTT